MWVDANQRTIESETYKPPPTYMYMQTRHTGPGRRSLCVYVCVNSGRFGFHAISSYTDQIQSEYTPHILDSLTNSYMYWEPSPTTRQEFMGLPLHTHKFTPVCVYCQAHSQTTLVDQETKSSVWYSFRKAMKWQSCSAVSYYVYVFHAIICWQNWNLMQTFNTIFSTSELTKRKLWYQPSRLYPHALAFWQIRCQPASEQPKPQHDLFIATNPISDDFWRSCHILSKMTSY